MDSGERGKDCYVVQFFLNGEEEYLNVYENEDDANKDIRSWCATNEGNQKAYTAGLLVTWVERKPRWHDLKTRCDSLEDTIVQWLQEGQTREWSNVIASITSRSLTDVYEALLRADRARKLVITQQVYTDNGPVCDVRVPFADDRIIWVLLDNPDGIWSDEISAVTGDELSEVHDELENLRIVRALDVLETRQTTSGLLMRVRLDAAERHRLLNLEWRRLPLNGPTPSTEPGARH